MKRYLLCVLSVFLLEALLLALLQDRPALAPYLPKSDQALTYAFAAAWPLGLIVLLVRRKRKSSSSSRKTRKSRAASGSKSRKPSKRKKKSGTSRSANLS